MGISGCGAGAVPSKQAKQTSKGLVFDAVRVLVYTSKGLAWFGAGVVLNKQARVWCGCKGAGLSQSKV